MSGDQRPKWPGLPILVGLVVLAIILYAYALASGQLEWPPRIHLNP